jgi:hypothetical protein
MPRHLRQGLLGVFLAFFGWQALAGEFVGGELHVAEKDEWLVLDGQLDFHFSTTALEALDNGVPLVVELQLNLRPRGAWFWETDLVDRSLWLQVRFLPLSRLYEVNDLSRSERRNFATRGAALASLGELSQIPLLEVTDLRGIERYEVRLRAILDIEALPLPLRLLAYVSPAWTLRSEWLTCPVEW